MQTLVDERQLKDLMKAALIEVFEERHDLIRSVVEEAFEDLGLVRAIEEGKGSGRVSREEVFAILQGTA